MSITGARQVAGRPSVRASQHPIFSRGLHPTPYLGPDSLWPSASALPSSGWGHFTGRDAMDLVSPEVLFASTGARTVVSSPVYRLSLAGLRRRRPAVLFLLGATPGPRHLPALHRSHLEKGLGGLRQATLCRTRTSPQIRRTVHALHRHLQQSPPRYR